MSILEPTSYQPTKADKVAKKASEIKQVPKQIAEDLVRAWENGFNALWSTEKIGNDTITPGDKLAAIGTDAKELFDLNTALVQFVAAQLNGKRLDLAARIYTKVQSMPEVAINDDGTVTIVPSLSA